MNHLLRKKSRSVKKDTKKTTLLIDCSTLTYAALYTTGHLSFEGKETGVIYGFLRKLLTISKKFKTNDFILCWDAGIGHRHLDYPGYKEKRKEKKKEYTLEEKEIHNSLLLQSLKLNHEIMPNLGFRNSFIQPMYEADDLLAYWVNKLKDKKNRIIMVTTDADMYQCLDHCDIWNPSKKTFITKKILQKNFGIEPSNWAMAKAIGGCDGDGVIGIEGVADPKKSTSKALKYLQGKLSEGKIKDRIESRKGKEIIIKNLPIVTTPYKEELMKRMIKRRNCYSRKRFMKVFDQYHFKSFLEKDNFIEWKESFLS